MSGVATSLSTAEPLRVERHDGVVVVTLDRPEMRNALSPGLLTALHDTMAELGARAPSDVRCVVLGAAGPVFAAGADLRELQRRSPKENLAYNEQILATFDAVDTLPVPSIAALSGHALGGGFELALACTLRIAAVSARFGFPEVKLGILPGAGGTQRLPRAIAAGAAWRLLLTGEPINGARALELGVVDEAVPAEQVDERAFALADAIAATAPLSVRAIMRAVRAGGEMALSDGIAYAHHQLPELLRSADHQEGLAAFAERRPPRFVGG
jgi:enoyl-CoA hydratase/carnithine racemase